MVKMYGIFLTCIILASTCIPGNNNDEFNSSSTICGPVLADKVTVQTNFWIWHLSTLHFNSSPIPIAKIKQN